MKKWLIVHSLESYSQNPRMIGFPAKTKLDGSFDLVNGKPVPSFKRIKEIKPGDKIVYYCKGDSVIKGIYEIVRPHFGKENKWPDSPYQFEIKPIIEMEDPYSFKLLLSSLDLFKHLPNLRKWGMSFQGKNNSIKPLTERDYQRIKTTIIQADKDTDEEKLEKKIELPDYKQHLLLQHQLAEWGLKSGYRVHIAINDKNKIKEKLPGILDKIPKFHSEEIVEIAKRIDVLFFEKNRDILTHAFEVEHTPIIYSGLLRLNDIAESYPSDKIKFFIIAEDQHRDKFYRELDRPSFLLLREFNCDFLSYNEVGQAWRDVKNRKPPKF